MQKDLSCSHCSHAGHTVEGCLSKIYSDLDVFDDDSDDEGEKEVLLIKEKGKEDVEKKSKEETKKPTHAASSSGSPRKKNATPSFSWKWRERRPLLSLPLRLKLPKHTLQTYAPCLVMLLTWNFPSLSSKSISQGQLQSLLSTTRL